MTFFYRNSYLALGLFSGLVSAGSMGEAVDHTAVFNGIYIGVGAAALHASTNEIVQDIFINNAAAEYDSDSTPSFLTPAIRFNLGYNWVVNSLGLLGAELGYRLASSSLEGQSDFYTTSGLNYFAGQALMQDIAPLVKAGIFVTPEALLYVGAGFNVTQFKFGYTDYVGGTHFKNNWKTGGSAALGLEARLNDSFTLDARYTYTNYTSMQDSAFASTPLGPNLTYVLSKPNTSMMSLTLNYHFYG